MAKTKRKSESLTAGITPLQFEEALAKYAGNDARVNALTSEMDEYITEIRAEYDSDLNILKKENEMLLAVIKGYAVQNRPSLFVDKKSMKTLYGVIGFRQNPPSLKAIKGKKWEDVLALLAEHLPGYIRKVEEPDKEKLLADRDKEEVSAKFPLIGVVVDQEEKFYIELKKEEVTA